MAKKPTGGGSTGAAGGATALAAALDALTRSVAALNPKIQALTAGFGSNTSNAPVYPHVVPTGTAPPPETLVTDQDKAGREKKKQEDDAAAEKAKYEPMNKAASRVQEFANAMQTIASMGGQPASAVMAVGGQVAKLTQNLPTLGKAFGDVVGGEMGASVTSLAGKFGPYAAAVGTFIQVAAGLPQLFKSAADSVSQYVQAFAPMASGRYTRAWQDLIASLGEQLLPVLDACTDVVRWFGDTIAGLTPIVKPVIQFIVTAVRPVGQLIGDVFRELLTEGVLLAEAFAPLAQLIAELSLGPLKLLAAGLQGVLNVVKALTRGVAGLLGLKVPAFDGSSVGKSAQAPEWSTTDDAWKKLVEATANQGQAAKEEEVPNLLKAIKEALDNLPAAIAEAWVNHFTGGGGKAGDGAGGGGVRFQNPASFDGNDWVAALAGVLGGVMGGAVSQGLRDQKRSTELKRN